MQHCCPLRTIAVTYNEVAVGMEQQALNPIFFSFF